jgi:putative flippase GtrA
MNFWKRDLVARYVIVGSTVFFIYYSVTKLLMLANFTVNVALVAALTLSILFQYVAHARFTFRASLLSLSQILRFLATVAAGFCVSRLALYVAPESLPYGQDFALVASALLLAMLNFIVYRAWVFTIGAARL